MSSVIHMVHGINHRLEMCGQWIVERLLEPVLLTVMGIGVAVLVVSVMYPLFTSIAKLGGQ